jgi:hypothetical protein
MGLVRRRQEQALTAISTLTRLLTRFTDLKQVGLGEVQLLLSVLQVQLALRVQLVQLVLRERTALTVLTGLTGLLQLLRLELPRRFLTQELPVSLTAAPLRLLYLISL